MKNNLSTVAAGCIRFCAVAAALCLCAAASAQNGTVAAGGAAAGGGYSLGVSVGQVAASAVSASGLRLNEGLQQGFSLEVERIAGAEGAPSVELFPNPTTGAVTLRRSGSLAVASVVLFSADGRQIGRQVWQGEQTTLDLTPLAAGSYMVRVALPARPPEVYKVVKR